MKDYLARNKRNAINSLRKGKLPSGYTVGSRRYGYALFSDTPFERNGQMVVHANSRIGGFETWEECIFAAHKHAQTQLYLRWDKLTSS